MLPVCGRAASPAAHLAPPQGTPVLGLYFRTPCSWTRRGRRPAISTRATSWTPTALVKRPAFLPFSAGTAAPRRR